MTILPTRRFDVGRTSRHAVPNEVGAGPTPLSYTYDLQLDVSTRSLQGHGRVVVRNDQTAPLDDVFLRVWTETPDLKRDGASGNVTSIAVDGAPATAATQDRTVVRIPLAHPLAAGEQATVDFDVAVAVAQSMGRTGRGRDGTPYFGNALPTLAVRDGEGWNLDPYVTGGESFYTLASDWTVRLHAPEDRQLITTGVLGAATVRAGMRDVTATATHARDFFIAAASGYQQLAAAVGATRVNVWAPAADAAIAQKMLRTATSSLQFLSDRYGTYDQPELDVIASRGLGGGMEYPGVTINDSTSSSSFLREVVAHENAHQWFYSMVGNNEFDDPWLDESFATYVTSEYLRTPVDRVVHVVRPGLTREPRGASTHISSPMNVLSGHGYVNTIYGDGARALAALHDSLGETTFVAGMRDWVASRRNDVGTTADYIATMSQRAGSDLTPWFAQHNIFATEPAANEKLDPNRGGM